MGTATGVVHNFWVVRGETFHTPMGTATGFSHRASRRRNGNISYPYGDSNEIPRLNKRILKKHFLPLWGQQQAGNRAIHLGLEETFLTPYGDSNQDSQLSFRFQDHRNISYPYGDSNDNGSNRITDSAETFLTPMGTATNAIPVVFCHN